MRIVPAGVLLALTALTAPAVANGRYDIDRLAYFEAGNSAEVEVDGNYLFAGIGRHLLILDVSDPTKPTKIASTVAAGPANIPRDIQVSGNHVFVTLGDYGLRIYDVSDPGNPTLAGTLDGVELWDFDIAGSTLIASSSSKTLQSVDISDVSNPSPISTATLSTSASGAVIQGDYAYVPGVGSSCSASSHRTASHGGRTLPGSKPRSMSMRMAITCLPWVPTPELVRWSSTTSPAARRFSGRRPQ